MRKNLTTEDLGDLLERPILAILATHRKDGRILMSPVWHEWTNGEFLLTTWANDIKSRNLKNDPRATVLVAENEPPYRGIEISGEATVEAMADHMPMYYRLATRYVGEKDGPSYAEAFRDEEFELIRLAPGVMRAWDFDDTH